MITVCDANAFLVQHAFGGADDSLMPPTRNTLDRHIIRYVAERRRRGELNASTARDVSYHLLQFSAAHGARPLDKLTTRAVDRWLARHRSWKPSTTRTRWSTVHRFCLWLVEHHHIERDPFAGLKPPKVPRPVVRTIPPDDVRALYAAAGDARGRLIVALMHELGARAVEVHRLNVEDIDWHARTVRLVGKGGHERLEPLTDRLAAMVETYLFEHPASSGALVRSYRDGARISNRTITDWLRHWLYEAGVKRTGYDRVSGHALRRTAATEVYAATRDIVVVKDLLGHADFSSLRSYVQGAGVERTREALRAREATR